jgi:hypothetical protein
MGLKFTTAYVPPEMVEIRNGIPVLLALGNENIEQAEVLKAVASFDVWSFGIVMFRLVMGCLPSSFGRVEDQDNLLLDPGCLVRWNDNARKDALSTVGDPSAKTLLSKLLDPDPIKRPSMDDVCGDYYFRPDAYISKLRKQLEKAKEDGDEVSMRRIMEQLKKMEEDGKETRAGVEVLNRKQDMLLEKVDDIALTLSNFQRATEAMLKSILIDEFAPKYVLMRPAGKEKGRLKNLKYRCNPKNWVNKKVEVYFVCPITLECVGEGYELTLPKDWVKKYGPAIRISLTVLKAACGVGRLAGLPIPNINDIADAVTERVFGDAEYVSNMLDNITKKMNKAGLGFVVEFMDEKVKDVTTIEVAKDVEGLPKPEEVVRASYAEIKQIAVLVQDPDFSRSGLVKAIGPDGSAEYVGQEVKELYEKKGEECLGLTRDEVKIMIQRLEGQSDRTQTDDNEQKCPE